MNSQQAPNLFTTMRPDVENGEPIFADGDCGIIMKLDGSFKVVTTGIDAEKLKGDSANYTDKEKAQLALGEKLMAIMLALSNDQIMDVLLNLLHDSDIVDPDKVAHVSRPN